METVNVGDQAVTMLEQGGQYAIVIDGTPIPILALSPGQLGRIQSLTGVTWADMIVEPLRRIDVAAELVAAALAKAGQPARDDLDTATLVRMFVQIPGDLPDPEPPGDGADENPTDAS